MKQAVVYFHSSETMPEVSDKSVKLLVGASVYLGRGTPWEKYAELYQRVYIKEGLRIIRDDGVFLVTTTNAYDSGKFVYKYQKLQELLVPAGWELLDERIWKRKAADFFQVPFTHALIFRPPNGTILRNDLNKNRKWFQGIWDYKQTPQQGNNAYPRDLCEMVVSTCTKEGDLVVDPFAGSGMLLAVAGGMNRQAVGYEIDTELTGALHQNGILTK